MECVFLTSLIFTLITAYFIVIICFEMYKRKLRFKGFKNGHVMIEPVLFLGFRISELNNLNAFYFGVHQAVFKIQSAFHFHLRFY